METDPNTSTGVTSDSADAGAVEAEVNVNAAPDPGPEVMRIYPAARMSKSPGINVRNVAGLPICVHDAAVLYNHVA